jgi:hypothetical protein
MTVRNCAASAPLRLSTIAHGHFVNPNRRSKPSTGPVSLSVMPWRLADEGRVYSLVVLMVVAFTSEACRWTAVAGDDAVESDFVLPKVEMSFSGGKREEVFDVQRTFVEMIPPKTIKRIVVLMDHGLKIKTKAGAGVDPDRLFAKLMASERHGSRECFLDARERSVCECLILTEKGSVFDDVYVVTVLGFPDRNGSVTGIFLSGKGFRCRIDFRDAPLECGALQ